MNEITTGTNKLDKIPKTTYAIIGVTLIFLAIVVGAFTISYVDQQKEKVLEFIVTDQGPYALDFREHDFVKELMNHESPTIKQFQNSTYWAKSLDKQTLLDLEYEILEGARANENKISVAEKVMLEIITWSAYPELCEENIKLPNCQFMDLNYNQARYERGEITRDEFWLNVKKYADDKTIAEVEKTDLT